MTRPCLRGRSKTRDNARQPVLKCGIAGKILWALMNPHRPMLVVSLSKCVKKVCPKILWTH